MRRGRRPWTAVCPPALLRRVHERIDAGRESAREIFDGEGLVKYARRRTFEDYCTRRRRSRAWSSSDGQSLEPASPSSANPSADAGDVLDLALAAMQRELEREEVPGYALPGYVKSMQGLLELKLKEQADRRAAEVHEAKMRELAEKLDGAPESVAGLTPEMVAEIKGKVLGL